MRHTAHLFGLLLLIVSASHAESATDARAEAMSALADARYEEAATIYRGRLVYRLVEDRAEAPVA